MPHLLLLYFLLLIKWIIKVVLNLTLPEQPNVWYVVLASMILPKLDLRVRIYSSKVLDLNSLSSGINSFGANSYATLL